VKRSVKVLRDTIVNVGHVMEPLVNYPIVMNNVRYHGINALLRLLNVNRNVRPMLRLGVKLGDTPNPE
jgi:hypothetical protein